MSREGAEATRKALIIESDKDFAEILGSFLDSHGIEVTHTDDGKRGLWLASTISPNIILLSLELKKSSGYLTLREFKEDDALKRIPLILMSNADANVEHDKLRELKDIAEDYIYKPFEDTEILRKVENFIGFAHEEEVGKTIQTLLAKNELEGDPELSALVRDIRAREIEEQGGKDAQLSAQVIPIKKARRHKEEKIKEAKQKESKKKEAKQKVAKQKTAKAKEAKEASDKSQKDDLAKKVKELKKEIEEFRGREEKYEAEISALHTQLGDLSLDHSLEIEGLLAEKENLLKRVMELSERVKALEATLREAKTLVETAAKAIEKGI